MLRYIYGRTAEARVVYLLANLTAARARFDIC